MKRLYAGVTLSFFALVGLTTLRPSRNVAARAESLPAKTDEAAVRFFETKIRPVLAENCVSCHGAKLQQGGVRLDTRAGFLRGGDSGPLIDSNVPDGGALLRAVHQTGPVKMPPGGKLGDAEIADLAEWVKRGAPWPGEVGAAAPKASDAAFPYPAASRKFWSFLSVKEPRVPVVKNRAWVQSPLDAFVLAGLEKRGLAPAPPADKRTLMRRATFDLTGLPPTPAEIAAFLSDKSPSAFATVVDRLLASPRYGERWGRHWLDLVRYTDSTDARGLGGAGDIAEAWRYRDWVIDAFNRDLPYDQFVMNQVAGDLMPPTPGADLNVAGTIATGMLAIGEWGNGDADKDKILTDIADDQVDVVTRGFLGLTVACARCHDHKFDPIPTKDYYGLAGIFFSTHILPKLTPKGAGETPLRIPLVTAAGQIRREAWQAQMTDAERREKETSDALRDAQAKRLLPETARYVAATWQYAHRPATQAQVSPSAWATQHDLLPYALRQWLGTLGLGEYRPMTTAFPDVLGTAGVHGWRGREDTPSLVVNTNADARTILSFTLPARSVSVHPGPTSGVSVAWRSPITGTVRVSGRVADADGGGGDGIAWKIDHRANNAALRELASGEFPNGGAQGFGTGTHAARLYSITVQPGDTLEIVVLPKQSHAFDTTTVELVINEVGGRGRTWNLAGDLLNGPDAGANPHADRYKNPDVWRFTDLAGGNRIVEGAENDPALPPNLAIWRRAVAADGSPEAVKRASAQFAQNFDAVDARSPFWIAQPEDEAALPPEERAALAAIRAERETLTRNAPPPVAFANGVQEGGCPESPHAGIHDVRVHIRGSYARLGDLVPRRFPVVLAGEQQTPIPPGVSGRLQLARWLASPKNPLTARVAVNRIWLYHFGQGIVRTPSNFGFLGERPTHPELLDWLAARFVRDGWSMKRMHRMILLSATYGQTSDGRPETRKADPDNRLWGRMNRRRLEAEAIRDNLLSVSGTLDARAMGGPAVRDFAGPRRTLYLMTIRSDRTGFGPLFDVANPGASVDRRTISNVAPQALFLLNDPFALDQARALAHRIEREAPDDKARIARASVLLYGRPATDAEIALGRSFLARARQTDSSVTPWEQYCQILLCANEFIYVD